MNGSTSATAAPPASGAAPGGLAQALQEAFTVTVRLRTGRQVASDARSFRSHIKGLLAAADRDARAAGYGPESVKRVIYAFVAFLDESVLNSSQAMFSDWPSQPLQEEIFGDHMAGETFFRHVQDLLGRQDSPEVADTLEVHHLCLLLGFRGRFGSADRGELAAVMREIDAKIRRVRGGRPPFAPAWRPTAEDVAPPGDPWIRRLAIAALAAAGVAVVLFVLYALLLRGPAGDLAELARGPLASGQLATDQLAIGTGG